MAMFAHKLASRHVYQRTRVSRPTVDGATMRFGKEGESATALLRNQFPFWSSYPARWHLGKYLVETFQLKFYFAEKAATMITVYNLAFSSRSTFY